MCNSLHPYNSEDHNLHQSNSYDDNDDLDLSVTDDLGFQSLMATTLAFNNWWPITPKPQPSVIDGHKIGF